MTTDISPVTRRELLKGIGATAVAAVSIRVALADAYKRADASWLANCHFGIESVQSCGLG